LARLVESRDLTPQVRHFVFEVPDVERLEYEPGQFVLLTDVVGGRPVTRAYSVCSAPKGNRFELCLNRVPNGSFTARLFDLKPGESVPMQGPLGYFTLRQPPSDSVFVANGTGIAPFRAMLQDPRLWESGRDFTLIFGTRYEHGLLYRDELEALEREHPNFRFWPVLSRPPAGWQGRTGHVQPYVLDAVGGRRDLDVYICGLKAMVDDVRRMLLEAGFERRRLIYEKYD
jgi:CDP-4-dehydro-6-deoxyglucose reductase